MEPTILQRSDHCVSRKHISRNALQVLYRLNEKGYKAYLAGGCVRDLLLGKSPKDFDVATDATPQQVKRCFRNCRLIGRRFRLAHVMFRDEVIEVATFRAPVDPEPDDEDSDEEENESTNIQLNEDGVVIRDNEYGTPEEDAFRRDFTVNALFYDIEDFSIIDYVGGLEDVKKKVVHCIGDPDQRYQEDPVRMIRALRFASTLDLEVEDNTYQAILRQRDHMSHASNARMYEEILKFFYSGAMEKAFSAWRNTGLLEIMFPGFAEWYQDQATEEDRNWHTMALQQLDKWKAHDIKASPELAYTLFLAPFVFSVRDRKKAEEDVSPRQALMDAVHEVQQGLFHRVLIPKKTAFRMFDLLQAQTRFTDRRSEQRIIRFLHRPYFRDALVLFKFDALASGKPQKDLIEAWTKDLQAAPPAQEKKERAHPQRRRRRRRRTHH